MLTSQAMTEEPASGQDAIRVSDGDPSRGDGERLLREMTDEIEELYADRDGSIHRVSISVEEMRAPDGAYLVLEARGTPFACGGLKRLDDETCEIKRMYIEPAWRGRGLSRVLLEALESRARELGYSHARLDTGDRQPAARHLYETAGYRPIADYNGNPLARFWFEREL
jgi:GNAT superfamily N-acetyltransferase